MSDQKRTDAEVIASVVTHHMKPEIATVTGPDGKDKAHLLITSQAGGTSIQSVKAYLDEYRSAPERRKGTAELGELASFIGHVKRFKDSDSAIFADRDPKRPSLLAVLDYHRAGATSSPRFGEHRARYAFPLADEWTAWTGQAGKALDQASFAAWLEDHLADVADPAQAGDGGREFLSLFSCAFASASKLLELSRGLNVHVGERVGNHVNLASGEATIAFVAQHADDQGKPLKVPGAFLLAIPVFRGGDLYKIPARLRYRVAQGVITWSFDLYRAPAVFDHAIGEACTTAQEETELPVFVGKPE
jgi:uncharacterized protein YfdQ (DUF2303 family)